MEYTTVLAAEYEYLVPVQPVRRSNTKYDVGIYPGATLVADTYMMKLDETLRVEKRMQLGGFMGPTTEGIENYYREMSDIATKLPAEDKVLACELNDSFVAIAFMGTQDYKRHVINKLKERGRMDKDSKYFILNADLETFNQRFGSWTAELTGVSCAAMENSIKLREADRPRGKTENEELAKKIRSGRQFMTDGNHVKIILAAAVRDGREWSGLFRGKVTALYTLWQYPGKKSPDIEFLSSPIALGVAKEVAQHEMETSFGRSSLLRSRPPQRYTALETQEELLNAMRVADKHQRRSQHHYQCIDDSLQGFIVFAGGIRLLKVQPTARYILLLRRICRLLSCCTRAAHSQQLQKNTKFFNWKNIKSNEN